MVAQTGSTYTSEKSMTDVIKIPTSNQIYLIIIKHIWSNLRFSTTASSKRVWTSPIMIDNRKWPPKPEILISLELWQRRNSNGKFSTFDHDKLDENAAKCLWQRRTVQNDKIGAQNVCIAISGCRSLSQSPGDSFFKLSEVENPGLLLEFWRYLT